ncbi:uroporphyrinogen-III synthase [uncultured Roseovarius sp.]|uniref:uroporphyrinogen-III synthase n=1 Tax=uncultured Roseovarius sp. TaxID=293344 RepID=UPI002624D0B7|nr:uroporphyrinogen-III synthase [uncultured Roseovarius sp.]
MPVTILIIRPEPEATRFAGHLQAVLGENAKVIVSPLIRIDYCGVLPHFSDDEVLIFTSRHGVSGFCRLTDRRGLTCYAVGDATAAAARAEGLRAISARGDAVALLDTIARDGARGPFLHLRGTHVAADVAGSLRAKGYKAQDAVVYEQHEANLTEKALAALGGKNKIILPLMSPRSARLFFSQLKACAGRLRAPLTIAAISSKVAEEVPDGAAYEVRVAETPDSHGVLKILQEQISATKWLEGGKRAQ